MAVFWVRRERGVGLCFSRLWWVFWELVIDNPALGGWVPSTDVVLLACPEALQGGG
jgi:hypothetical protein